MSAKRIPKVRKKSRKESKVQNKSENGFLEAFRTFFETFFGLLGPRAREFFWDFLETFWLLAARLPLPGPRNLKSALAIGICDYWTLVVALNWLPKLREWRVTTALGNPFLCRQLKGPRRTKNTTRSKFTMRSEFTTALWFTIAAPCADTIFQGIIDVFLSKKGLQRSKYGGCSKNSTA